MNILIVDDSFVIRKLVEQIVKKTKVFKKIYIAENGLEAKDILKREEIDMLILDMLMPKVSGEEVLDFINEHQELGNIPIIVFSTDDDNKNIALDKGAHDFIHKPVSEAKLIATIKKYVEL